MTHGYTRTTPGRTVLPRRSRGHTALGIALAVAVAGFFVTIALPAFGFAAEDLMPLRPATPPPTLPELLPVRPPEKKTSVRPGPLKNIVRVRIPSPIRYENDAGFTQNAADTAIRPPETTAIRPSSAPAAVVAMETPRAASAPARRPVTTRQPFASGAPPLTTVPGVPVAPTVPNRTHTSGEFAVSADPSVSAVTSPTAVMPSVRAHSVAARASAAPTVSRVVVRSGTGTGTGISTAPVPASRPAEPTYQVHGSLAVPTIILPPAASSGGVTGQALIPGLVTPEDLAKPALALQEFNETIERDMADLIDFGEMDALALGSSVAEFLAGPVTPSMAPSALPARVMHGDDIVQDADRDLAAGAAGPYLPIPSSAGRSDDISAMVPPSMLVGSRLPAGPGTPTRSRPVARAPSRFDQGAGSPTAASRRSLPMAPVTLPPPLSFAQSARPADSRHAVTMPPPPAASFSPPGAAHEYPPPAPVPEARPESAARLAGFDQLLGRSGSDRVESLADITMSIPGAIQRATPADPAGDAVGMPTQSLAATTVSAGSASRYPLPALPPTARLDAAADAGDSEAPTGARGDSRLDMAAGIDTLKVRVREQVREDTAEKAARQAPRPDEARLYDLPEAPVQARKGSITDFEPTIARPKAIVRDEDSDLIVVPANGVRPSGTKAPRRLTGTKNAAANASAATAAGDGRLQAGQVESIRIPPKTNIPLPPGLFDEEELAELERRGYRVERPVVKARDDADEPAPKEARDAAERPSGGKKSSGVSSGAVSGPTAGTVGKATKEPSGKNAAADDAPTETLADRPNAENPDADSGHPPALSPSLFRNRKKPTTETASPDNVPDDVPDNVPGEVWEREPVTGFTPVRQARNLFNSILGR